MPGKGSATNLRFLPVFQSFFFLFSPFIISCCYFAIYLTIDISLTSHSNTATLKYRNIQTLKHSNTTAFKHRNIRTRQHSNTEIFEHRSTSNHLEPLNRPELRNIIQRNPHRKGCSLAFFTLQADRALMKKNNILRDRKPQPGTACLA